MPVFKHFTRFFLLIVFWHAWGSLTPVQAQAGSTNEATVNLESLFIDAMQQVILGNPDKAINRFNEVLAKDPTNAAAAYELSKIYVTKEEFDQAFDWAQKASQWEPSNPYYQLQLARQYEHKQVFTAAAGIYEKLAASGNLYEDDYEVWSHDLVEAGKPEEAITVLDKLEQMVGVHESLIQQKYQLYVQLNKPAKAEAELNKLVSAYPQEIRFRLLLASHFMEINKPDKAKEVYKAVLQMDPDNAQANLALSKSLKASGADDQYLHSIQSILSNPQVPLDDKIKELIPYLDKQIQHPEAALGRALIDAGQGLNQAHPGEAKVQALLGDIYQTNGQDAQAISAYLSALELQPAIWSIWEQALPLLIKNEQYQHILAYAPRGMDYFPNQALLYYALGIAQIHVNQIKEAQQNLSDASLMAGKSSPLAVSIRAGQILAQQRSGQRSTIAGLYEQLLKEAPQAFPVWQQYLEYLSEDESTQSQAQNLLNDLTRSYPDYGGFLESQAFLSYRTKDFTRAGQAIQKYLDGGGATNARATELAGDIAFQTGAIDQAVALWHHALDLPNNRSEELQKKISSRQLVE